MAVDVQVVPATAAHAEALAPVLRPEDADELFALGLDPGAHLREAVATSELALAVIFDGEVAMLVGLGQQWVSPEGRRTSCVWALSGPGVEKHKKAFLRTSRAVLAQLLERSEVLWNFVDVRYAAALRWVKWMGFSVGPSRCIGPNAAFFHPISIRRDAWAH